MLPDAQICTICIAICAPYLDLLLPCLCSVLIALLLVGDAFLIHRLAQWSLLSPSHREATVVIDVGTLCLIESLQQDTGADAALLSLDDGSTFWVLKVRLAPC